MGSQGLLEGLKGSSVVLRGLSRSLRDSLDLSGTLKGFQRGLRDLQEPSEDS